MFGFESGGRVLYGLAWLAGRLPLPVLHWLGDLCAWLARMTSAREYRVAQVNFSLIEPGLDADASERRVRAMLAETWHGALETLALWTRPVARNLRRVDGVYGGEVFDAALAAGRGPGKKGLIIAAPHYGNWELLNQWLARRTPIAILYRAPNFAAVEAFLRRVRGRLGAGVNEIIPIRADAAGVRKLLRHLQGGGVVGILPDQQPKAGEGEFAPFFGIPALTMTLLSRLAARSGAPVLIAYAERVAGARFNIRIEPAPAAIADLDLRVATTALNAAVETVARRDFRQYQWTYKRYTLRPPDSGEANPYWPRCYSRRLRVLVSRD